MTIKVPSSHVFAWKNVLSELLGDPIDRTNSSNGQQFKTDSGVSITLWAKKKDKSTVLSTEKKYWEKNIYQQFVMKEIPPIYQKVKIKLLDKKRKREALPGVSVKCEKCDTVI